VAPIEVGIELAKQSVYWLLRLSVRKVMSALYVEHSLAYEGFVLQIVFLLTSSESKV
jgi:hypothetical protein